MLFHVILSTLGGDRRISAMTSATRLPNANRPETLTMSSRKQHLSLKAAVNAQSRRHPAAKDLKTTVSILATRGRDDPPLSKRRSVGLSARSFRPGSPGIGHCRGLQDDKVGGRTVQTCDSWMLFRNCSLVNALGGGGADEPIRIKLRPTRKGRCVRSPPGRCLGVAGSMDLDRDTQINNCPFEWTGLPHSKGVP